MSVDTTAPRLDDMDYFGPWLTRPGQRSVRIVVPVARRAESRRIRDRNREYRARLRGATIQTVDTSTRPLFAGGAE